MIPTVLVVGEGDFSLSLSIVRQLEDAVQLVATTVRDRCESTRLFPQAQAAINELSARGVVVCHRVNARSLHSHIFPTVNNFDIIIFTFPFADPHNGPHDQRHVLLVAEFLSSARRILRSNGEIAITLHVSPSGTSQFDSWNVQRAAVDASRLHFVDCLTFDAFHRFPGYTARTTEGTRFIYNGGRTYVFSSRPLTQSVMYRPLVQRCSKFFLCVEESLLNVVLADGFTARSRPNVAVSKTKHDACLAYSRYHSTAGALLQVLDDAPLVMYVNAFGSFRVAGRFIPPQSLRLVGAMEVLD